MPTTPVPLLVLIKSVNLHWLLVVGQCAVRGSRQRPCWSDWEGYLGKDGADAGGRPGLEGTLASIWPLASQELTHNPGVSDPILINIRKDTLGSTTEIKRPINLFF